MMNYRTFRDIESSRPVYPSNEVRFPRNPNEFRLHHKLRFLDDKTRERAWTGVAKILSTNGLSLKNIQPHVNETRVLPEGSAERIGIAFDTYCKYARAMKDERMKNLALQVGNIAQEVAELIEKRRIPARRKELLDIVEASRLEIWMITDHPFEKIEDRLGCCKDGDEANELKRRLRELQDRYHFLIDEVVGEKGFYEEYGV